MIVQVVVIHEVLHPAHTDGFERNKALSVQVRMN